MIALHRLAQPDHEFFLNPDLIQMVEANPDTVVTLTNGTRHLVAESPAQVAELVAQWRGGVLTRAIAVSTDPKTGESIGTVLQFPGGSYS
jgi:flagellar protein FlbD